ncbi:MAG: hypothetical protein HC887_00065 [Desulfobacteraceae bacterium]|nr:hypothetical protein [Desulfobacteraceae bacterium]
MNGLAFMVFCIVAIFALGAIIAVVAWHISDCRHRERISEKSEDRTQRREDMKFQLEMMKEYGVSPNALIQPQIPVYPPMYQNQQTQYPYPTQVYEIPASRELVRR